MANSRKQFAFDLITEEGSPLYKYYSTRSGAYDAIGRFMKENGCGHRQYSVYTSDKKMSKAEVTELIAKMCEKLPWLSECTRQFDVTDIGKQYSLTGDIREACEIYEDKRQKWEEKHATKTGKTMEEKQLLDINDYKDAPLFGALIELNERLKEEGISGIQLNVVGGFAMMTHDLRSKDGITDIDYIGTDLPRKVEEIADQIGFKYNLGRHWINNDVLMAGSSLEDLEFTTGKLHFREAFEMESLKINILETEDLLKMKMIAIDTSLSAVELGDGDFTRSKDFADIEALKGALEMDNRTLRAKFGEYLMSDYTIPAVKAYEIGGMDKVKSEILPQVARQNRELYMGLGAVSYKRDDFIESILKRAGIDDRQGAPNKASPDTPRKSSPDFGDDR